LKKTNVELTVGASIFIALFVLIAGVMWLKEINIASKMVEYTVLFPNVGTLQVGDPVTVSGVKRGEAAKIYLYKAQAAVVIKLDRTIRLTDSSTITIQNIGLMGERQIGIQLSENGTPYRPNTKQQVTMIQGRFDSGIAEAMGMLGRVLTDVQSLLQNVTQIIDTTIGDTSFVTFFDKVVGRLDTVTYLVEDIVTQNKSEINSSLANLHTITSDVQSLLDENKPHINSIMANGSELTGRAVTLAQRADSIATSLKGMVNAIERGEGSIGMLVQDEQFYHKLKESVSGLDTLLDDVNQNGLKLRIKLGFKTDNKK
jgi:phospholipid/cholesterol/gamma-HCH transport system substrate-binding protein